MVVTALAAQPAADECCALPGFLLELCTARDGGLRRFLSNRDSRPGEFDELHFTAYCAGGLEQRLQALLGRLMGLLHSLNQAGHGRQLQRTRVLVGGFTNRARAVGAGVVVLERVVGGRLAKLACVLGDTVHAALLAGLSRLVAGLVVLPLSPRDGSARRVGLEVLSRIVASRTLHMSVRAYIGIAIHARAGAAVGVFCSLLTALRV